MTLTEFLRARFAEDEKQADIDENIGHISFLGYQRAMAEVEAKRRIMEEHQAEERDSHLRFAHLPDRCTVCTETGDYDLPMLVWPCPTILALALPYADHLDFREEWRT